jgi:hypothetical protein
MKQWAKREAQIERVMNATVGMYGDLQGIAGKSLQEIEGLEPEALGADDTPALQLSPGPAPDEMKSALPHAGEADGEAGG